MQLHVSKQCYFESRNTILIMLGPIQVQACNSTCTHHAWHLQMSTYQHVSQALCYVWLLCRAGHIEDVCVPAVSTSVERVAGSLLSRVSL